MLHRPAPPAPAPDPGAELARPAPGLPEPLVCDTSRRFVRVTEERADGLVAFDFAIGWPELSVELLLPRAAFDEFCTTNHVIRLAPPAEQPTPDPDGEETDE